MIHQGAGSSNKTNAALKELASGENEFTVDYKYILLEDLGTASSWLILLLPYVAFFLALLLESSKSLKVATMDPLAAKASCVMLMKGGDDEWISGGNNRQQQHSSSLLILPAPAAPCHTSFQLSGTTDRPRALQRHVGRVQQDLDQLLGDGL